MKRREACLLIAGAPAAAAFASQQADTGEQVWLGPEYWANRLQDWRLRKGRMECVAAGGDRNVFLLTHELSVRREAFEISVRTGPLELPSGEAAHGYAGFRIGMHGPFQDYRDTAIYGIGLDAGLSVAGRLFIGSLEHAVSAAVPSREITLRLRGEPSGDACRLTLEALDASGKPVAQVTRAGVSPAWVSGGVALVCSSQAVHPTPDPSQNVMTMSGVNRKGREAGGVARFWFRDWKLAGAKVDAHPERAWGPILFAMHTLSRRVLKLTAQLAPVDPAGKVELQFRRGAAWQTAGHSSIDPLARTATFRIQGWDDTHDVLYRIVYGGQYFEGTIRRDPRDKSKLRVAALSCMNDLGFPHTDIVRNLRHFRADLLLFVGDQIYEHSASYGIERLPLERAVLDYLRKWYLFGWTYQDLLRDTPCVCMPDDHDVYHGNVWGDGGRHAEGFGQAAQDSGGYVEPAAWVNTVQRTQTSHLPDPFDPTPVLQGIGVYYTDLLYGGVSFAILEDRKWKSSPKRVLPKARIVNGWAQNPAYHAPRDGDVPGAELLGPRQIRFLEHWARDWTGGVWMKAAVSQTLFANVATLPPPATGDDITPRLPVLPPGGYAEGEVRVADHDSNGWPQTPRNTALRVIRRALALHIAGDQHLGSTVQYGVEAWNDASWAICVPAISNLFPRRWYPAEPGKNRNPGAPRNSGEYLDGFGNRVTVQAVANPHAVGVEPVIVNHRAPGYGILEFDRATQSVSVTNWPRWVDASRAGARPFEGWPITIRQLQNGLPDSGWVLDAVERGAEDAVLIEVAEQPSNRHVYTCRMVEFKFQPPVPGPGTYQVIVRNASGKIVGQRSQTAVKRGA